MEYDENQAIDFISQRLSEEARQRIDGDEILIIIDIIFDYYDRHHLLDIDIEDDDDALDVDDLIAYVAREVAKDKESPVLREDVDVLVHAALDYEKTLD